MLHVSNVTGKANVICSVFWGVFQLIKINAALVKLLDE